MCPFCAPKYTVSYTGLGATIDALGYTFPTSGSFLVSCTNEIYDTLPGDDVGTCENGQCCGDPSGPPGGWTCAGGLSCGGSGWNASVSVERFPEGHDIGILAHLSDISFGVCPTPGVYGVTSAAADAGVTLTGTPSSIVVSL